MPGEHHQDRKAAPRGTKGWLIMSAMYWMRRGSAEFCGVDSTTRDTCELAIAGDEKALRELHPSSLDEALHALDTCRKHGCDAHASERDARVLLDRVYHSEVEKEEGRPEWLGDPVCTECAGGCRLCLGLPAQGVSL